MTHHPFRSVAFLGALACLAAANFGCSGDDDHGPVIGAPTTPVVISEGGSAPAGGAPTFGGTTSFNTGGVGGFGVAGTTGFGVGGTIGTTDPFTGAGTLGVAAGPGSGAGTFGF